MAGMAITLLLIAISIPMYKSAMLRSRETTLTVNLGSIRDVIKLYTKEKKRAPQSLQDLVDASYFRQLPIDPITNSNSTWQPVIETVEISPGKTDRGITDVQSGSNSISSEGTSYRTW